MATSAPQHYGNHARLLPPYHFIAFPLLLINLIAAAYSLWQAPGVTTLIGLGTAFGVFVLLAVSRVMALTVQDRVIRLEERLRMRELLPSDLLPRIEAFTPKQLVALRFASDAELPALARKVLDERIEDQKVIKQLVTSWRADHLRA